MLEVVLLTLLRGRRPVIVPETPSVLVRRLPAPADGTSPGDDAKVLRVYDHVSSDDTINLLVIHVALQDGSAHNSYQWADKHRVGHVHTLYTCC